MNGFRIIAIFISFIPFITLAADEPKALATVEELWPTSIPAKNRSTPKWYGSGRGTASFINMSPSTSARSKANRLGWRRSLASPGSEKTAGLLHLHGGGQRAFLSEVEFYARRGYACVSINWGGREMEDAKEGDPARTGARLIQRRRTCQVTLISSPVTNTSIRSSRPATTTGTCSRWGQTWLTFLEQQPEVDADRLGVLWSLDGRQSDCIRCRGGQSGESRCTFGGWIRFPHRPWPLLPQVKMETPNGDVKLFNATLGFESCASHIKAPLLWLGSTNDFHGIMDDTYRTSELIPHKNVRYSFTPHMNHRFTPEFAVTRPLWFDQLPQGELQFSEDTGLEFGPYHSDHVPELQVTPDSSQTVAEVHIYYSVDPDPRAGSGGQPRRRKPEAPGQPGCRSLPSINLYSHSPTSLIL